MLLTLHLISVNVYNNVEAPPRRGFSFLELWMIGMQLPIIFALVEYSIILGLKKHWTHKENTENKVKIAFPSKSDKMKKATTNDMANALAYKIDIISFVVSALFYILFSFFYWFMLNV